MDKYTALKTFKHVYHENSITVLHTEQIDEKNWLIEADFPDGIFYFTVSENTVSNSYNDADSAIRSVL